MNSSGVFCEHGNSINNCPRCETMEYAAAAHAMQSGVRFEIENEYPTVASNEPLIRCLKHLRVGINSALSSHDALARLLMEKGLFTEAEYVEAVRRAMNREVAQYEERLTELFGREVKLR